jgi:diketogulonate reductase-like aldo/keto reductase
MSKNFFAKTFTLNNGLKIPCIGYGTWELPEGGKTISAVKGALSAGYQHIDTAAAYENEKSVSLAIKEANMSRNEVFITSKVWLTSMGYDKTLVSFDKTLKALDTDYLDLLLIHVPAVESMAGIKSFYMARYGTFV